jgi:hypothetical protein
MAVYHRGLRTLFQCCMGSNKCQRDVQSQDNDQVLVVAHPRLRIAE